MAEELTYNEAGTHVLVKHVEHGGVWECPVGVLHTMRKLGWEPTQPDEDADLVGLTDETQPEAPVLFDPAEHDAKVVTEHLATHAEVNPAEVHRVIDAERAGKNRKSVVVPDGFDPITGD